MEKSRKEQEERLGDRKEKETAIEKEPYALCNMSKESTERGIRAAHLRSDDDKKADISFLRDQRKGRKMHMGSSDFRYIKKSQRKMKRHEQHAACALCVNMLHTVRDSHGPEEHMCTSGPCGHGS